MNSLFRRIPVVKELNYLRKTSFLRKNMHMMGGPIITLTPLESLFRRCLLDCRDEMRSSVPGMDQLELRWTGGWVRDKLLGVQSHDIDVALSTMTGRQFGEALQTYMKGTGQKYVTEAQEQGFNSSIKDLHEIAANPEKSKHLETITTHMFGIDVDFVNLRKEVYDETSRNPQMEFGTPEEDALRRDATVNALFYNLDLQGVEDFTRRGLEDMDKKIIRTPLAPYQTFKDDPLRVLRLIRFASRLGYEIESNALEAMRDQTIHKALRLKISRERVGVEIGKIVTGPDPLSGLMYIYNSNMYATVFANPGSDYCPDSGKLPYVYESVRKILKECQDVSSSLRLVEDLGSVWTLATYVPWKDSRPEAIAAAREAIKATNIFSKLLGDAIQQRPNIQRLVDSTASEQATRKLVGMTLRKAGLSWRFHVLYSLLCDILEQDFESAVSRYRLLLTYITDQRLTEAATLKPIINGNEIKQALAVAKAGPWLAKLLEVIVEWQLENPQGTADDAKRMVADKKDELDIG